MPLFPLYVSKRILCRSAGLARVGLRRRHGLRHGDDGALVIEAGQMDFAHLRLAATHDLDGFGRFFDFLGVRSALEREEVAAALDKRQETQVASAKDIGINVSAYLITSSDFAKNNTETLTNYLKALDESVKYINDNLDESAEKISKKYGIEPDDFKTNWEQYSIKLGLSEEAASHLDEINKWAYDNGKYPNSYNIREFYYPDSAKKAFPDNVTADLTKTDK